MRQLLEFGLPTLLAPGNMPALAAALPCEFVVASSGEDMAAIQAHPNWRRLTALCPARLEPIDDLISDASHATTLTLAYARSIRATGPAMTDCAFLFLVADFLLADGSLTAVLKRLQAGASGVLAGNFQVTQEGMAPHLAATRAFAPRDLVRLSLQHLHPDTTAVTVNGDFRQNRAVNRLFWRVDRETMLGRFYLAHMIGIRPEVADFRVGASCDYSFIPELCPSGNVEFLSDSDEYFAVEMQAAGLAATPAGGPLDVVRLGADLSNWTTARHRQNARTTVVFHAGDIPPVFGEVAAEAEATIQDIAAALSPAPRPHRDHPYWVGGLALHRATTGRLPEAELGYGLADEAATITGLLWRLRLAAFGRPPSVRPWHPRAPDFAGVRKALAGAERLLIVADEPRTFAHWLQPMAVTVSTRDAAHVLNGAPSAEAGAFDTCLIVLAEDALAATGALLAGIAPSLTAEATVIVLVTRPVAEEISLVAPAAGHALAQAGWSGTPRYVNAGPVRRAVQRRLVRRMRAAYHAPLALLPFQVLAWAALAAASYVCNLTAFRPAARPRTRYSSILLALHRAAPHADRAAAPFRRPSAELKASCAIS